MRRKCVNLAHLRHDFAVEPTGYAAVESDVPEAERLLLEETFCPFEAGAMLRAVSTIMRIYEQIAPPLAAEHGITYPAGVEKVLTERLGKLRGA
jgi:hypothetical protein